MSLQRFAQVIGDPIAQSKSPLIHSFWLEKLGIDASYSARRVSEDAVPEYLDEMRKDASWLGANVTMPHKEAALRNADRVDPLAQRIGAANTLVNEGSALAAYNTDAAGFLEPLLPLLGRPHLFRMARILGTGGAARAIVAALYDEGFTIVLAGRNPDKAQALLDELAPSGQHYAVHLDHFAAPTDFAFDDREGCLDLVVNASPLGMAGQEPLLFDWSHAPPGSIAYDIVTNPVETPFLKDALAHGHRTIGGLAMLIGQAAIAFEKFYGVGPPRAHDDELRLLLEAK